VKPTDWITAIAAIVNAVSVIALVGITWHYARLTGKILDESHKSREAAERQATAAQANIDFLKRQLEEEKGLGRLNLRSTISTAIRSIQYWNALRLGDLSRAGSLPDPNNLVPPNSQTVLDHARSVSPFVGKLVAEGFDYLEIAKNEIVRVKNANAAIQIKALYDDRASEANSYLSLALTKLEEAQTTIDRVLASGVH
jgi:hypothetical protein